MLKYFFHFDRGTTRHHTTTINRREEGFDFLGMAILRQETPGRPEEVRVDIPGVHREKSESGEVCLPNQSRHRNLCPPS